MPSSAEGDSNRELSTVRKIQSASQSNVAVQCFFVLPIEAIVVGQIGPAIIHADKSTRCFGERNSGPYREPCTSLCVREEPCNRQCVESRRCCASRRFRGAVHKGHTS